jgi:hypothetical protein
MQVPAQGDTGFSPGQRFVLESLWLLPSMHQDVTWSNLGSVPGAYRVACDFPRC